MKIRSDRAAISPRVVVDTVHGSLGGVPHNLLKNRRILVKVRFLKFFILIKTYLTNSYTYFDKI